MSPFFGNEDFVLMFAIRKKENVSSIDYGVL